MFSWNGKFQRILSRVQRNVNVGFYIRFLFTMYRRKKWNKDIFYFITSVQTVGRRCKTMIEIVEIWNSEIHRRRIMDMIVGVIKWTGVCTGPKILLQSDGIHDTGARISEFIHNHDRRFIFRHKITTRLLTFYCNGVRFVISLFLSVNDLSTRDRDPINNIRDGKRFV